MDVSIYKVRGVVSLEAAFSRVLNVCPQVLSTFRGKDTEVGDVSSRKHID